MSDPIEMAIAKIQALEVMAVSEIDRVYNQALHNAIAVVKGMPSAQPDSKELSFTHKALDTISRQAAIDALDERFDDIPMEQTTEILL